MTMQVKNTPKNTCRHTRIGPLARHTGIGPLTHRHTGIGPLTPCHQRRHTGAGRYPLQYMYSKFLGSCSCLRKNDKVLAGNNTKQATMDPDLRRGDAVLVPSNHNPYSSPMTNITHKSGIQTIPPPSYRRRPVSIAIYVFKISRFLFLPAQE